MDDLYKKEEMKVTASLQQHGAGITSHPHHLVPVQGNHRILRFSAEQKRRTATGIRSSACLVLYHRAFRTVHRNTLQPTLPV